MDQNPIELEIVWGEIETGISRLKRIFQGIDSVRLTTQEYIDLYTAIYNMSALRRPNEYAERLYQLFENTLEDCIRSVVLPSLEDKHGELLLMEWLVSWKNHKALVESLGRLFRNLEKNNNVRTPLSVLGIHCFNDLVFKELKTTLATAVSDMINDERDGQIIDRALVKGVLDTFFEIGRFGMHLYKCHFEPVFYKGTADFYAKKAQAWMLENSCAEYMFKVEECLQKEKERVAHYLHSSTEPKLLEDTMLELVSRRAEQILNKDNSGCLVLLLDGKTNDLSRMYRLFSKMEGGLYQVCEIFKKHVSEEGMSLLNHTADAANSRKDFVRKAIELHDKHITYVTKCFQNHVAFHKALKEAFILFCNEDIGGYSSAESLAAFCDNILLKGGSEKLSDEAVEETLDKAVHILTYISDKDLFLKFHRINLGKRLILYKGVDNEHEHSLLAKLRQYLGSRSTSNMEGMLAEITVDHQEKFKVYMNKEHPESVSEVDLHVSVLTTGCWPTYNNFSIDLPSEMIKCVEDFKSYYKEQHKDRKLNWIHSIGSCNIIAKFDTKPIELIVTTYQAALLLLFNETDELSYSEIVSQLNIPDEAAVCLLHSLSCAKYKILDKEPSNGTISPSDIFKLNTKFTHEMGRIKVPFLRTDRKQEIMDDVKQDRSHSIQACIVRIMKSHQVMRHEQLVSECIEQLSHLFKPQINDIKKEIEALIKMEYLEVDPNKPSMYTYIA